MCRNNGNTIGNKHHNSNLATAQFCGLAVAGLPFLLLPLQVLVVVVVVVVVPVLVLPVLIIAAGEVVVAMALLLRQNR